jgi:hypothetical protein
MKTKEQIINEINHLIDLTQQNRESLQPIYPIYNREILTIKERFYTIADNLTSEFTEQELYTIENNLLFNYQTLQEIFDFIKGSLQSCNPPTAIIPIQQYYNVPPISFSEINSLVIKQEDIDEYKIYIQRRIEGIKKEIEKKQKLQLQNMAEIYQLYNGLADNLTQEMMAMDEKLYDRQTQQHEAKIKNIINDLDGV